MNTVPELMPVSELRQHQSQVWQKLPEGPVILTQRGRAFAVVVSPEEWNRLIEELQEYQDALAAIEARREAEPGIELEEYAARRAEHVSGHPE